MKGFALFLALPLAACSNPASNAERQYEIIIKGPSPSLAEMCDAARRATDAWLERGDAAKYEYWRWRRDRDCDAARRLF